MKTNHEAEKWKAKSDGLVRQMEGMDRAFKAEKARLKKEIAWVEKYRSMKPDHPDDERPWCSYLLDANHEIERLQGLLKEIKETTMNSKGGESTTRLIAVFKIACKAEQV